MLERELVERWRRRDFCEGCPYRGRARVGPAGSLKSAIVIVGQCPGKTEAQTGIPFTGKAGYRLNKLLLDAGLKREDLYITNVVKCFVEPGESVDKKAIRHCRKFLDLELEALNPKLLIALGRVAEDTLQSYQGRVFPMVHPAAALRNPLHEARLRIQTKELKIVLDKLS